MNFQKFEMIVETIALFWVICCVVIWFIHRKRKKVTAGKLKKRMICVSIIVFAGYFMSNLVKCTISFASLEKAVVSKTTCFYCSKIL